MTRISRRAVLAALAIGGGLASAGTDSQTAVVSFRHEPSVLHIDIGGRPFADYVYGDKVITRPFFAHVKTPAGVQVTRNHPPDPDKDLTDHATFHPGLWMSFGDVSGNDSWRLKAKVEHEMFVVQEMNDANTLLLTGAFRF